MMVVEGPLGTAWNMVENWRIRILIAHLQTGQSELSAPTGNKIGTCSVQYSL